MHTRFGGTSGSVVKNPSAMQEMQVWSLDWEDPLEEGMATHSSILAWEIPWTEEPGGLLSKESDMTEVTEHIYTDLGKLVNISEKVMAPHSSTLAWKIPWTEEPSRLQSMGLLGVGHDWVTSLSLFTFMHWRELATHSSVLAWRIPGTGEPGGLPSMGSHRVRHNWSNLAAAANIYILFI